jgi:ribonuclease G
VVADIVEANLDFLITRQNERKLTLAVHPFLFAYFTKGLPSRQMKWYMRHRTWTKLIEDSTLGITDFRFMNGLGQTIELQR